MFGEPTEFDLEGIGLIPASSLDVEAYRHQIDLVLRISHPSTYYSDKDWIITLEAVKVLEQFYNRCDISVYPSGSQFVSIGLRNFWLRVLKNERDLDMLEFYSSLVRLEKFNTLDRRKLINQAGRIPSVLETGLRICRVLGVDSMFDHYEYYMINDESYIQFAHYPQSYLSPLSLYTSHSLTC